jgi:hypothetical protein
VRAPFKQHPATRPCLPGILLACLAAACASPATIGSASNSPAPGALAVVLETSGSARETLRVLEGTFEVDCLWWPTSGADPITSRGMLHSFWDATADMVIAEFDGELQGGFSPSVLRIGWDATRECYVSDWWDGSGNLLLRIADGHSQPEGELVFTRGTAAASSIQVLTVLGDDEHLIELGNQIGASGSAPHALLRLSCRRRDPAQ